MNGKNAHLKVRLIFFLNLIVQKLVMKPQDSIEDEMYPCKSGKGIKLSTTDND